MVPFNRPPTSDEMQYAGDIIRGKLPFDVKVIIASTIAGAVFGIAVGISSASSQEAPLDLGFTAMTAVVCALTFAVIAILIMNSIRSIQAVYRIWLPARIIFWAAIAWLVLRWVKRLQFIFIVGPANAVSQIVLGTLGLIFFVLFLNIGIRLVFIVYCMVTGKDEDEIVTRSIAAQDRASQDLPSRDQPSQDGV